MREHHEIEMDGKRFKLLPAFYEKYERSDLYQVLETGGKKHCMR
jgi:hypothetical protein